MFRLSRLFIIALFALPVVVALQAQDTRKVNEPAFPIVCSVHRAPLTADANGPVIDPASEDMESSNESAVRTMMMQQCHAGQAVELASICATR
jgi:hypothetical protein